VVGAFIRDRLSTPHYADLSLLDKRFSRHVGVFRLEPDKLGQPPFEVSIIAFWTNKQFEQVELARFGGRLRACGDSLGPVGLFIVHG
jgi:hypothetical protein